MPDFITCPHCQHKLALPADSAGKTVACPECRAVFQGPAEILDVIPVAPPPSRNWVGHGINVEPTPPRPTAPNPWEQIHPATAPAASLPRRQTTSLSKVAGWSILGVLAIGFLYFINAVSGPRPSAGFQSINAFEDRANRREDVIGAMKDGQPVVDPVLAAELKVPFDALGAACRAQQQQQIADQFDGERMFDAIVAQGGVPPAIMRQREAFARGMRTGLGNSLAQNAQMHWVAVDIRSIKKLSPTEVLVIVRHRTDNGVTMKMRWWMIQNAGAWKFYDLEDLDGGIRVSTLANNLAGLGVEQAAKINGAAAEIRGAIQAIAQQDPDSAEKKLERLARFKLPSKIEGVRLMLLGSVRVEQGKYKEAIVILDEALKLHDDMPMVDLLKGIAYNRQSEWGTGLIHLQAYRELLGDDPIVCVELGRSLRGVGRFLEAQVIYRKVLDEDPTNADAFSGLLYALAVGEKRDDLGERFTKLQDQAENFETFAEFCKKYKDAESLEILALTMRGLDPTNASAEYHLALARIWSKKHLLAIVPLRAALTKQKDEQLRQGYVKGYCEAMIEDHKHVEAYTTCPDGLAAFRIIAANLKQGYRADDLRQLIALHTAKFPKDEILPFYRGHLYVIEEEYEQADKTFTAAMAKPLDPPTLGEFRASRVTARYQIGQVMAAYSEIGPRRDTFEQLARLAYFDDNLPQLEVLLAAHAKADADDPGLQRYRLRLQIKRNQIPQAVALFKTALAKQQGEEEKENLISDFLGDMLNAGATVAGYQAAPDPRQAFRILTEQMMDEDGNSDDLPALVKAHRPANADDPRLALYQGELHLRDEAWEKAVVVLREGMRKAPKEMLNQFRYRYLRAMHKAGKDIEAYREAGDDNAYVFQTLAYHLVGDRNGAVLQELVKVHQNVVGPTAEVLNFDSRAKMFLHLPDQAVPLLLSAWTKQQDDNIKRGYVTTFVRDMLQADKPFEAYEASPDKSVALEILASHFINKKQIKELTTLLAKYRNQQADNALAQFCAGELYLLQGNIPAAEKAFAAAFAQTNPQNDWRFRNGLYRARVRAGHVALAYQEAQPSRITFTQLAYVCQTEKSPKQLEALLAVHRKANPDDPNLIQWDLELQWLNQNYEQVVKYITSHREQLDRPRSRWTTNDYLVRSLVRLKKTKEAIEEAETIAKKKRGHALLLVLAHASAGDVKQTIAMVEKQMPRNYLLENCYQDNDLGPILRSDTFREFRERFPEVKREKRDDDDD